MTAAASRRHRRSSPRRRHWPERHHDQERAEPHDPRADIEPSVARKRVVDQTAGQFVRRVIQRAPSSIPGREIVQVETEIPVGVESGWHVHPGEEVGYIVAGNVEMKVQGRPTVILRAGDGFLIPPRTPHNARDLGPETGRMLSTYIVEPGQSLATFVDQHADKAAH
jgi:quercetin dioxygenase-like cupin family protein